MGPIKDDLLRNYLAHLMPKSGLEGFVESSTPLNVGVQSELKLTRALEKLALGKLLAARDQFYIEALIIPQTITTIIQISERAGKATGMVLTEPE